MPTIGLGESIPQDTAHAVSVSLPTWKSNVGYEEGERWVLDSMTTGYPRFFVHKSIFALASLVVSRHGTTDQEAMLFPSAASADRCLKFIQKRTASHEHGSISIVGLCLDSTRPEVASMNDYQLFLGAVLMPARFASIAKQYWQHSGEGVSSRRAEFYLGLLQDNLLVRDDSNCTQSSAVISHATLHKHKSRQGPKRYQRPTSKGNEITSSNASSDNHVVQAELHDPVRFVEERFGRNLDMSLANRAKKAIKRRIAGTCTVEQVSKDGSVSSPRQTNLRGGHEQATEDDVYLFPCGMNAIFTAHRLLLNVRGAMKSVTFGFPYVDTLKVLQKFGPGCIFYGHASEADLDDLEHRLRANGERFLALFCEFPGNPLLTCPDLVRIRSLAVEFDFAVVVDETIGTFANVNVLQYADIVVSSLTKIFSGDCNVMGGGAIINPQSRYYDQLKAAAAIDCEEDNYWPEDVIFMERNSRDFSARIPRINANSEAVCELLLSCSLVKAVFYPKYGSTKTNFDKCRLPNGGYGGLLSMVFHHASHAAIFYDELGLAKGPSLGTNFTIVSPYALLAHYQELDWAESLGVDRNLIRISVGLEDTQQLLATFAAALAAAMAVSLDSDRQIHA